MDKSLKYHKALEYEIFVKEEYGFAKEKIKEAKCVFDIWWHVWYFSEWCRKYNKTAKIYYYEPISELYEQAEERLKGDKNIFLYNVWISAKRGKWKLLYNEDKTMQSSRFSSFLNPNWEERMVNFITFSDAIKKCWCSVIDLVKMDIEWMEFEVLNSLTSDNRGKINNIIIEVHLLNDWFEEKRKNLYGTIKGKFPLVKIIPSWYTEKIFLVWAMKN